VCVIIVVLQASYRSLSTFFLSALEIV
jgi:hypothetical protein